MGCLRIAMGDLKVLKLAPRGCFKNLKSLVMQNLGLHDSEMVYLERAIERGGLPSLEELDLTGNYETSGVVSALRHGGCPRL